MSLAAKRGPPTSEPSMLNWRFTPASHRPADSGLSVKPVTREPTSQKRQSWSKMGFVALLDMARPVKIYVRVDVRVRGDPERSTCPKMLELAATQANAPTLISSARTHREGARRDGRK